MKDFKRAISLDESIEVAWYFRAQIYLLLAKTSEAESDLQTAIKLAQDLLANTPEDQRIPLRLALYTLVQGDLATAEAQYASLVSTIQSPIIMQEALEALEDFLVIQPSHESAKRLIAQLQARLDELTQLPVK